MPADSQNRESIRQLQMQDDDSRWWTSDDDYDRLSSERDRLLKSLEFIGPFVDEVVADRDRLAGEVERLRRYARHLTDCACERDRRLRATACTCGLTPKHSLGTDEQPVSEPDDDLDPSLFEPTVGYCSKCGEARTEHYTCRDGGSTIPKTEENDRG